MAPRLMSSATRGGIFKQMLLVTVVCVLCIAPWFYNALHPKTDVSFFSREVTISGDWPPSVSVQDLKEGLANTTEALTARVNAILEARDVRLASTVSEVVKATLKDNLQEPVSGVHSWRETRDDLPRLANPVDGTLCGYPASQLETYLARAHGDGSPLNPDTNRYFVSGVWRNITGAWAAVDQLQGHMDMVCILVAAKQISPCWNDECVFQLFARPGATDMAVVHQIFDSDEYGFVHHLQPPRNILDAGGNVGMASLVYGLMWPEARIITVEPSSGNYAVLVKNVRSLPNVTPVHAGLWAKDTKLAIQPNNRLEWGVVVTELDSTTLLDVNADIMTGVSVPALIDLFDVTDGFDFIKMDIEGSEGVVLDASHPGNDMTWLEKADVMVAEFHERFDESPTGDVARAKKALIAHPHFRYTRDLELDVFVNRRTNISLGVAPPT